MYSDTHAQDFHPLTEALISIGSPPCISGTHTSTFHKKKQELVGTYTEFKPFVHNITYTYMYMYVIHRIIKNVGGRLVGRIHCICFSFCQVNVNNPGLVYTGDFCEYNPLNCPRARPEGRDEFVPCSGKCRGKEGRDEFVEGGRKGRVCAVFRQV